jgi:hypothetical protein
MFLRSIYREGENNGWNTFLKNSKTKCEGYHGNNLVKHTEQNK